MGDHMNQPAYARHRRAKGLSGVTRQSVETALADGRIHLEDDGKIDPARADREWEANTDPVRKSSENSDMTKARAAKAMAEAERAQLDLAERRGEVVKVEQVRRRWFELTRRTRDRLMVIPARLAGELAAETDARAIEQRMDAEIREALIALTGDGAI